MLPIALTACSTPPPPTTGAGGQAGGSVVEAAALIDLHGGMVHDVEPFDEDGDGATDLLLTIQAGEVLARGPDGRIEWRMTAESLPPAGRPVELLAEGASLILLLDRQAVQQYRIERDRPPVLVRTWDRDELGLIPTRLASLAGEQYVLGVGGVTRLATGERSLEIPGEAVSLVITNFGPTATAGRRAYQLSTGRFVGSASVLAPINLATSPAAFVYARNSEQGSTVGLMDGGLRELDAFAGSRSLDQPVLDVRVIGDRAWIMLPTAIEAYRIDRDRLRSVRTLQLPGPRGLARINPSTIRIVGAFGEIDVDAELVQVDAVGLDPPLGAVSAWRNDGRAVVVRGALANFIYEPPAPPQPVSRPSGQTLTAEPPRAAAVVGATASIDPEASELLIAFDGAADADSEAVDLPGDAAILTVAAVKGRFWIGTDRGLVILSRPIDGDVDVDERIAIPGGVKAILPLYGDRGVVIITIDGAVGHLGG